MNKEEPYQDQAERLRKRVAHSVDNSNASSSVNELPPRSEVHSQKKKKTKWKLKYPIIRILVLFFVLLPIVIFSIYTYLNEGKGERVGNEREDYEWVDFDDRQSDQ